MKIERIKIRNVLGIERLDIEPGKAITEISGPNGSGKSSVLEAIKSVVKGGEDATLLRKGAETGEVVLVIDDGTEIRKTLTDKGTSTTVRRNGKNQPHPMTLIKALTDMLSVNPVEFLAADEKRRVNVLLESMPISADASRLTEIMGSEVTLGNGDVSPLDLINSFRKNLFDERTGTNRAIREKESTINQLAQTLPDGDINVPAGAEDLVAALAKIDTDKDDILRRIDNQIGRIRKEVADEMAGIRAEYEEKRQDLQKQMDDLRDDYQSKLKGREDHLAERERAAHKARDERTAEAVAARQEVQTKLSSIQAAQSLRTKHDTTRQTIKQMNGELDSLKADAEKQTARIDARETYKAELLNNLPIKGLEVNERGVFRDGIPFDRLNTGQKVAVAVEIAKLRAGNLGIACVDGLELLDTEHYEEFRNAASASGLQLFITRVDDHEFTVTTGD